MCVLCVSCARALYVCYIYRRVSCCVCVREVCGMLVCICVCGLVVSACLDCARVKYLSVWSMCVLCVHVSFVLCVCV